MQVSTNKMKLISNSVNSQIYRYGEGQSKVVLKIVNSESLKQSKHLSNQYNFLKQLDHQNIIYALKYKENIGIKGLPEFTNEQQNTQDESTLNKNMELFSQKQSQYNVLVLEHAQIGSFLDLIKKAKLKVGQIRQLVIQTAQAIQYLHCKYIVHRDLKLDNILITSEQGALKVKLADFGFASSCLNRQTNNLIQFNTFKGTKRGFMAPEIHAILQNPNRYYDARKSDIFALGVTLFAAVFGTLPFEYATMQNRFYKLIAQEKYDQFWRCHAAVVNRKLEGVERQMFPDFQLLFQGMVNADPAKRLSIEEVLESDWMYGMRIKTSAPQI